MKDTYCSYCGHPYPLEQHWPRRCLNCSQLTFRNPKPVVVVLQPVDEDVVLILRNIEPGKGLWALPGGFIDFGERWEVAAARELQEETGIPADANEAELITVENGTDGQTLLIFCRFPGRRRVDLPTFRPDEEVSDVQIVSSQMLKTYSFAFNIHYTIIRVHFDTCQTEGI